MNRLKEYFYAAVAYSITYPLRAVTPGMALAVIYMGAESVWTRKLAFTRTWRRLLLSLYAVGDLWFFLWFQRALRRAQRIHHPPDVSMERRMKVWKYISECHPPGEKPFQFLDGWFHPVPLEALGRDNLKVWLAWALFDRRLSQVSSEAAERLEEIVTEIEQKRGIHFRATPIPHRARLYCLNLDPVIAQHRPLVYYAATSAMDLASDAMLYVMGFRRHTVGGISYWFLPCDRTKSPRTPGRAGSRESALPGEPGSNKKTDEVEVDVGAEGAEDASSDEQQRPIVFVHGVGVGLVTYLPFVRALARSQRGSRPILMLELPHVSMKLGAAVPRMSTIARSAKRAMAEHGLGPALWVGHSLGTFIVAAVNELHPELIHSVVLIDPVCFLLWEADLVRNFCYRTPSTPMQVIQHFHISRELFISHYFHRHFFWIECVFFAEQLPSKAVIFISQDDDIYDTRRVRDYLARHGNAEVVIFPGIGHGGWIVDASSTKKVLDTVTSIS
eukprot:jgi/Mesvir1/18916/Mv18903-RA.1